MMQSLPVLNLLQDTGRGWGQEALRSLPCRVRADHTTAAAQHRPKNSSTSGHRCWELPARWVGWLRATQGQRRRTSLGKWDDIHAGSNFPAGHTCHLSRAALEGIAFHPGRVALLKWRRRRRPDSCQGKSEAAGWEPAQVFWLGRCCHCPGLEAGSGAIPARWHSGQVGSFPPPLQQHHRSRSMCGPAIALIPSALVTTCRPPLDLQQDHEHFTGRWEDTGWYWQPPHSLCGRESSLWAWQ